MRREAERVRKYRARRSLTGRDIGRLPPVADPQRKRACARDLKLFCKTYFPELFPLPFSPDHHTVIGQLETCALDGGLFALAMPRGSGKTTICEVAALWAVAYGHHKYVLTIGATIAGGLKLLDWIKVAIRTNELFAADFPEICFPIRALEGITQRSKGQLYHGRPTWIDWSRYRIVLPTIPGAPASGAIIEATGITADNIRGRQFARPDGTIVRPSFVILDDPQTDKSARSRDQCNKREAIVNGTILGLAGPGEKIAAAMPCTVIQQDDFADRLLDRGRHQAWNGIRTKTLYSFPTNEALWNEYWEVRNEGLKTEGTVDRGNAFYEKHRAKMDAGAAAAWPERFRSDELSAIQSAMNLYLRDRHAFMAEGQNEPINRNAQTQIRLLTASQIADKLNRVPRGQVPVDCQVLEAHIDVQGTVLYWHLVGCSLEFSGGVVDHGTWPDQGRSYFTLADIRHPIAEAVEATALEGQLYAALEALTERLLARSYQTPGGVELQVNHCMIDANWQTNLVYKFCRESKHAARLVPGHGRFIGATSKPISAYQKKPGERIGEEWVYGRAAQHRAIRHLTYDANYWKTFAHARLATSAGDRGSLAMFGASPIDHRMVADHYLAESPTLVEARGRKVIEWKEKPERPDNHGFDNLVGCLVLASLDGCALLNHTAPAAKPATSRRKRVSYFNN